MVQLFVFCFCAVQRPVGVLLLHPEAEEIWLGDNEVQVLVIDLGYVLCRACRGRLGSEIFEQGSGYRGEEVDVG